MRFLKASRKGGFFYIKLEEIIVLPCEFYDKQV